MFKSPPYLFDTFRRLENETSWGQKTNSSFRLNFDLLGHSRSSGQKLLVETTCPKVALQEADVDFRCLSKPQIDASKYPSNDRLDIEYRLLVGLYKYENLD